MTDNPNLSRRAFARGAAIAGALASVPLAAALAEGIQPDAKLLRLHNELLEAKARHALLEDEMLRLELVAEEQYPPTPRRITCRNISTGETWLVSRHELERRRDIERSIWGAKGKDADEAFEQRLAILTEYESQRRAIDERVGYVGAGDRVDASSLELDRIERAIQETPAEGFAGISIKLRWWKNHMTEDGLTDWSSDFALHAMEDLERLTGEAAS